MWEISQKMYSFTEITIFDNSPALPESLPIYAANVKRSRQAERSTAFAADKRGTIGHISHKKKDDGLPVIPYP